MGTAKKLLLKNVDLEELLRDVSCFALTIIVLVISMFDIYFQISSSPKYL